jgi:hypothetical protein
VLGKMIMQILKTIRRPKAAHIVILERDDGHTYFASTFNPQGVVLRLNGAGFLTHRCQVVDSPHAEAIVEAVGRQFELHRRDAFGPWYVADYDDVLRVLNDYDTETGRRWRDARFEIGARVRVTGAGKGAIKGFRGQMLIVTLDTPSGAAREVIAPKSLVKPVLRLIPDSALPAA